MDGCPVPSLIYGCLSYTGLPGDGTIHNGLGLPTALAIKKVLQIWPQVNLMEAILHRLPLPRFAKSTTSQA